MPALQTYFDTLPRKTFSISQLVEIIQEQRSDWKVSKRIKPTTLVEELLKDKKLLQINLKSTNYPAITQVHMGSS